MDLKFMQDLHNREFATKESLAQRASTIIAGITTLGGLLAFVVVNFRSVGHSIDVGFWLLIAASGIALSVTAFYLIWSYRVPPLNEIARPKEWLSYWNDLKTQVKAGKVASAETEFTEYLLSQYADIADRNIDANFKRGTRLVNSNNFLLASFFFIVTSSLAFYYNNYILRDEIRPKGGNQMFSGKDTLVCIPAAQVLDAGCGDGPNPRPKPRPVPIPGPDPGP